MRLSWHASARIEGLFDTTSAFTEFARCSI
jgi:hypothetical protein